MPSQEDTATTFLDSNKNIFSLGLGFTMKDKKEIFKDSFSVDLHVQLHHLMPTYTEKTTGNFGGYTSEGMILNTGATLSYRY